MIIKYDINKYNFRNNIYCLIKQDEDYPNINDNWIKSNNNMCIYELDDKIYYAFLKNEDNEIFKVDGTNKLGVIITKRKKSELQNEFPHVVLMDKYYINDGNLTNMW